MIKELPQSENSVLGFEITGKVSEEEERRWIARFDDAVEEHGKVSALVVLGDGASWGIKAGFEVLKWLMTHLSKLHKIAIVSDSAVWKWLVNVDSPFAKIMGIGEKHFEHSRIDEAWAWLKK